jgi:hypothetical protein
MRFRLWLPALQTIGMLLIVWAPWSPGAHDLQVALTDGSKVRIWILLPGPNALDWVEGINLPAVPVVTPVEYALRNGRTLRNPNVMFLGLWLVGLLCWYMVGRFVDDLIRWRRTRQLPTKHPGDLTFALLAAPSALLIALAVTFGAAGPPVIVGWGLVWVVVSSAALVFRTLQYFQQSRRRPR